MEALSHSYAILPLMSQNAYTTDTRFGKAQDWVRRVEGIAGRPVLHTIVQAEPIGPKGLVDLLAVAPCTGNTLSKIAAGITDTPVTMGGEVRLAHRHPGGAVLRHQRRHGCLRSQPAAAAEHEKRLPGSPAPG